MGLLPAPRVVGSRLCSLVARSPRVTAAGLQSGDWRALSGAHGWRCLDCMAGYWLPSLCCAYSCGCVLSPVGILPGALASGVWQWLPAHSRAGTHSHGSHGWRLALPVWRVLSRWLDCMTGHPPARGECLPRGLRLALSRLPALLAHSLPGWLDYSPRVLPRGSPLDCSPGGCHSPGGWIAWRGAPRRVACAHGWRLAAPWFRLAVAGGSFPRHSWRGMAPRFPWRALPWRALPWLPALHGSRALSMVTCSSR